MWFVTISLASLACFPAQSALIQRVCYRYVWLGTRTVCQAPSRLSCCALRHKSTAK